MRIPAPIESVYYRSLHPIGNLRRGENSFPYSDSSCSVGVIRRSDRDFMEPQTAGSELVPPNMSLDTRMVL